MHDPHFDGVSRLRTPGEPHADNGSGEGESLDQRTSFHHLNPWVVVMLFGKLEPGLLEAVQGDLPDLRLTDGDVIGQDALCLDGLLLKDRL